MNCKLEKFWNDISSNGFAKKPFMNCKLEKFWNSSYFVLNKQIVKMNCKLEKFWNHSSTSKIRIYFQHELKTWKVLKSMFNLGKKSICSNELKTWKVLKFIYLYKLFSSIWMNYKLEKFWNLIALYETL